MAYEVRRELGLDSRPPYGIDKQKINMYSSKYYNPKGDTNEQQTKHTT